MQRSGGALLAAGLDGGNAEIFFLKGRKESGHRRASRSTSAAGAVLFMQPGKARHLASRILVTNGQEEHSGNHGLLAVRNLI